TRHSLQSPLEATLAFRALAAPLVDRLAIYPPVIRQYGHDPKGVQAPWNRRTPWFHWLHSEPDSEETPFLTINPAAAIGAEQMQLFAGRDGPDAFADGRGDGAGNAHQHLARRQLAGIGGHLLRLALARAVQEGLGADAL